MAKDPAFLFYYQDFLVGTDHMSLEQKGAYITCLCHQANKGFVRPQHMKNICQSHENHEIVKEKFSTDENGNFYNVRLRNEIERRRNYSASRRLNRLGSKSQKITYVPHMETETENIITKDKRRIDKIHNSNIKGARVQGYKETSKYLDNLEGEHEVH